MDIEKMGLEVFGIYDKTVNLVAKLGKLKKINRSETLKNRIRQNLFYILKEWL